MSCINLLVYFLALLGHVSKSTKPSYVTVFLAPPVRFTNKSGLLDVVTCSAQTTAQLSAEVSDYDAQVCNMTTHYL